MPKRRVLRRFRDAADDVEEALVAPPPPLAPPAAAEPPPMEAEVDRAANNDAEVLPLISLLGDHFNDRGA